MTRWLATVDPKRVPLFAAAAIALVAATLALYVVLPQAKAHSAAREERALLAGAADAAAALAAERAALEATVRGLVALAGERDPSSHSLEASMIARLQDLTRRHGVELVAVQPSVGAEVGTLQETVFDVELVGEYGDIVAYLGDVRTELDALVVRELSLLPLDDASQPKIHVVLVGAAFGETR
jgi:hypothetical protein